MRRILVLKGGGVRGIIRPETLEMLENYYQKPIYEIFDLIVGTSVGSIIGGILATGKYSVAKFYHQFLRYLPQIFKKRRQLFPFKPIYNRMRFYEMWDDLFGKYDENLCMNECKTKFLCTSVNLCDSRTHYFKSWEKKDGCISLREAIARSFAAPYYFGAMVDPETKSVWFDGGSGESNTPLNIAHTESIKLGWAHENMEFIALGSGNVDYSVPYEKARKLGNIRQLFTYMSPLEGGLARIQAALNQVDQMRIKSEAEEHIDFHYYDIEIGPEYRGLDKLQFIREYKAFGSIIAQQLETDLKNKIIK